MKNRITIHVLLTWLACLAVRLASCRVLPIDPLPALIMHKRPSFLMMNIFVFTQFLAVSFVTQSYGWVVLYSACMYGVVGYGASYLLQKYNRTFCNDFLWTGLFIIAFDCSTGLVLGPLLYNQPFMHALIGQIPFTFWHILTSYAILCALKLYTSTHFSFFINRQLQEDGYEYPKH